MSEVKNKPKQKRWTTEEVDFLKTWYGNKPIPWIASKLDRPVGSVQRKIERMKLPRTTEAAGKITVYQLAKSLNVDNHTVYLWIEKHEMPHQKKVVGYEKEYILINVKRFWNWAKKSQSLINFSKIERNVLLPEPEWFDDARKRDAEMIPNKTQQYWTEEEDKEIWYLFYKRGYTQERIGKEMNRSRRAVQKRLSVLRNRKKQKVKSQ